MTVLLSSRAQQAPRAPLENEHFHVIVIGGGINGVAIARECARSGFRTLLVEQHDFAAGTTSRSTRLIHGGLRYLEHGEIGQVIESLRERRWLLQHYPHLVTPVRFLLALDEHSRRSALAVRAGLWMYRQIGGTWLPEDKSRDEEAKLKRLLDSGRRFSIFSFEDAQCEFPERLVAAWLVEAMQAGAVVRNYTQVLEIEVRDGRARGILVRDGPAQSEQRVTCEWIINATGPWADELCRSSRINTKHPMVGGVRGSHIVMPRFPGAPEAALYTEAVDGRPIFVIPWNGSVLVGTTEVPDTDDPGRVHPSADETTYLLRSLANLFPRRKFSVSDVQYAFAGVRPLPFSPSADPSAVSRKHFLHDHEADAAAGMISVIGGKLTTAASLARECGKTIGLRPAFQPVLAIAPSDKVEAAMDCLVTSFGKAGEITPESARGLVEWYGVRSLAIAETAQADAALRLPLCKHTSHIVAEAAHAFANESAVTLGDVLLRRVPVALGPCWSLECGRTAAARIGAVLNWSETKTALELEAFESERDDFLRKPTLVGTSP